jgi:hypothetical protein
MEMVDEDSEARKKPRWGEEMKTEYSGGLGSVTQINEASEDEDSDDDDDDDDGEVIEVDGDGLRLREQCVALMMDDDDNEEAKQICKACKQVPFFPLSSTASHRRSL